MLSWHVLEYEKEEISLQIIFENPQEIGFANALDYITVTFWGVDLFKSSEGIAVQFGSKLAYQIQR